MVTRSVLAEASRLVPAVQLEERDVARHLVAAEADGIRSTPTVLVYGASGDEVVRAEGAPTLAQVLGALAKAL